MSRSTIKSERWLVAKDRIDGQESVFSEDDRQREKFGSSGMPSNENPVKKALQREKRTAEGVGPRRKAKQKSGEE